jgi:hypothetical protein
VFARSSVPSCWCHQRDFTARISSSPVLQRRDEQKAIQPFPGAGPEA